MYRDQIEISDRGAGAVPDRTFRIRRGWLFDAAVVGILPALFLFAAPIQKFLPAGWVDPALYLGLSMDYFDIVKTYGWDYHSLRVSFLLPNALANMVLPVVHARLLVVFAFYFLGLFALYDGARILWGRPSAAITVSCLAYSPVYLLANTAGYVDGAYIAYTFCVFAALARWSISLNSLWVVIAGMAATLGILAHALAAAPVGLVILFFLIAKWNDFIRKPLTFIIGGLIGAVLTWIFFLVVLYKIGFGISAFVQLKWIVNASITGLGAKYRFSVMDWLPYATRLVPGIVVSLTLIFLLVSARLREVRRIDVSATIVAVASTAILPVYDLTFGGSTTQSSFYAGLAVPGIMIGITAMTAMLLPQVENIRLAIYVAITLILATLSYFSLRVSNFFAASGLSLDLFALVACCIAISLLLLTPLRKAAPFKTATLTAILTLCGLSVVMNKDTQQLYKSANTIDNEEYFRGSIFVRNLITADVLEGRLPLFWFDRDDFAARDGRSQELARKIRYGDAEMALTFYDTVASLRLWQRSFFLPELTPGQVLDSLPFLMNPNVTVVVLEQDNAKLDAAINSLRNAGVSCHVGNTSTFHSQSFDMNVTLIELRGAGDKTASSCGRT
ncbi:hypothetical protein C241_01644 [Bradyrhizobium lupini HPC(L)]|uniref:Glycosyltransferase RgtA/B/C/D-like domain-containing protein n=1 Tax=Bradyrhizobium lupini HPC(L) TaxID=1229491 RepID=A0ABN0HS64_RHILU|nr:hypothetical protein C241_01644 [Bradyrhizobium lupini HPC(L)]